MSILQVRPQGTGPNKVFMVDQENRIQAYINSPKEVSVVKKQNKKKKSRLDYTTT